MSHLNYLPSKNSAWKKRMIEILKTLPRASYTQTIRFTDRATGKKKERLVTRTVTDNDIRRFVCREFISPNPDSNSN